MVLSQAYSRVVLSLFVQVRACELAGIYLTRRGEPLNARARRRDRERTHTHTTAAQHGTMSTRCRASVALVETPVGCVVELAGSGGVACEIGYEHWVPAMVSINPQGHDPVYTYRVP